MPTKLTLRIMGKPAYGLGITVNKRGLWFAIVHCTTAVNVFWWRMVVVQFAWPPIRWLDIFAAKDL